LARLQKCKNPKGKEGLWFRINQEILAFILTAAALVLLMNLWRKIACNT